MKNNQVSISPGNRKMGYIPSVSLPPIVTCASGCACCEKCYAAKMCRIYPSCGLAIYYANTRKACAALAHSAEMQEKINNIAPEWMAKNNQVFNVCVMNAEMGV